MHVDQPMSNGGTRWRPGSRMCPASRLSAAALILAITGLTGCVTERLPRPQGSSPYLAAGVDPSRPRATSARTIPGPPVDLTTNGANSRLRFEIKVLGTFQYDGATLPLVSPDGRYVALQVGQPPPWGAILATEPVQALATGIEIYDLAQTPPALIASSGADGTPQANSDLLPGMLLGRSVTSEGFLIEWPRPDGSRWIGLAGWSQPAVRWLVGGLPENGTDEPPEPTYAAHGVLLRYGTLLYASPSPDARGWVLSQMTPEQQVTVIDPRVSQVIMPVVTVDGSSAACLALREGLLALYDVTKESTTRFLTIKTSAQPLDAYAAFASFAPSGAVPCVQATGPMQAQLQELNASVLFFDAQKTRLSTWNPGNGRLVSLAAGSMSAAMVDDGLFMTTEHSLKWIAANQGNVRVAGSLTTGVGSGGETRVLDEPAVIRAAGPGWILLATPVPGRSDQLRLALLSKTLNSTQIKP